MEVFVLFQAVYVLSYMIVNTEAELSLTVISPLGESTVNDLNTPRNFECNAEATLVCEVKPYTDSVSWQINGHTYALCIYQDCFTYPPFPENHTFSMDLASDVFNLTMNPVTNSTNNNIYKCDDGITARSVKATVKVYPTNETLKMDTTADDRITVTTGCVYPNGIGDVTFEWYISKDNETLEQEPLTSYKYERTDIFNCTETPSCTVEETSHFNNTVIFYVSDDWELYYIYVVIKHKDAPNRPFSVQSTGRRYKVKEMDKVKDCHCCIIIIIILAAVRFHSIQSLFCGYRLYKLLPENGLKHSTNEYKWMGILACIPVVGLILPTITACREVKICKKKQVVYSVPVPVEVHPSVSYAIIGISFVVTLIDPAFGMCVTSILVAISNKVTIAASWVFIMFLVIGCLIVISVEVVMLIVSAVLCLKKIYIYVLLMLLYLVLLWTYLTRVVIYLQTKIEEREREFCCDTCRKAGHHISAAHAFCLTCSAYLCTLCLIAKHKTCTLLWIQRRTVETGQKLCCEGIEDHRELPLEGVCLTCESYICTRCLNNPNEHRTHLVSSHQQEHSTGTGRWLHRCCDRNYTDEVQKTINYCLNCQRYLCRYCFTNHRQHILFCDQSIEGKNVQPTSEILCKGCEGYKRLPVECYNLHHDEFLCAKCFERGHKSVPWKRTRYRSSETLSFKERLRNQQPRCQIHSVLGGSPSSHVEVYCLVCKIYMCRECFFGHRRIAEYWIKKQKGNLFYCNICKKDEHVYPVECCNLKTGEYLCANCYESDKHYSTRKYAAGQNEGVRQITINLKEHVRPCQIHMFPFHKQEREIVGDVYCLVCKLYLCRHCFELHRRLKYVWQQQQKPFQEDSSTDYIYNNYIVSLANHPERTSSYQVSTTDIHLMVWWHFPLAGWIIASIHLFYKSMRERQVNPANQN